MQLSPRWRILDDGRQWVLQVHKGGEWRPRRYHVERKMLLAGIVELCGEVDQAVIWTIRRDWPKLYRPRVAPGRGGRLSPAVIGGTLSQRSPRHKRPGLS